MRSLVQLLLLVVLASWVGWNCVVRFWLVTLLSLVWFPLSLVSYILPFQTELCMSHQVPLLSAVCCLIRHGHTLVYTVYCIAVRLS